MSAFLVWNSVKGSSHTPNSRDDHLPDMSERDLYLADYRDAPLQTQFDLELDDREYQLVARRRLPGKNIAQQGFHFMCEMVLRV